MAENSCSNSTCSKSFVLLSILAAILIVTIPVLMALKKPAPAAGIADEADARIQPVARVELAKASETPTTATSAETPATTPNTETTPSTEHGTAAPETPSPTTSAAKAPEAIFKSTCFVCHNTGAGGAPKMTDKAAWAPRIAQGKEVLYQSVIKGKNAMPPKGGAASLTEEEIKGAVDYMVSIAQ